MPKAQAIGPTIPKNKSQLGNSRRSPFSFSDFAPRAIAKMYSSVSPFASMFAEIMAANWVNSIGDCFLFGAPRYSIGEK